MTPKLANALFDQHFGAKPDSKYLEMEFKGLDLKELLKSQHSADFIKSKIGRGRFQEALGVYFSQFRKKNGEVDFEALGRDMEANLAAYVRHLGDLKADFLSVLISEVDYSGPGFLN